MADKLPWLEEVKRDAEYNYHKRLRQQEEDRKYEESKQSSETLETKVEAKSEDFDTEKGK